MYLEREDVPAVLITVDFEKCFDSVEHSTLFSSLKLFNIGSYFLSWIIMLYKGFEYCVSNNGWHSRFHKQTRRVHQGSALSGPLFLFMAELLS